jgi:ATP-dependent Clp protease ATP-binding subunit ClpB
VILFDEIEKAHPDVFNVLLQVLDDGRLTDGQGRTVDFKNTVVILTSNVGSAELAALEERHERDDVASREELSRGVAMEALRRVFRPEFINRLDEIVVYHRLAREQIRRIVEIQLQRLHQRLAQRELTLAISEEAKDYLGELGWDPQFGARPLGRAIRKHLEDELAKRVLGGELGPGDTIFVDRSPIGLSFKRVVAGESVPEAVSKARLSALN